MNDNKDTTVEVPDPNQPEDSSQHLTESDFELWVSPVQLNSTRQQIAAHLRACPQCRQRLEAWAEGNGLSDALAAAFTDAADVTAISDDESTGTVDQIPAEQTSSTAQSYSPSTT